MTARVRILALVLFGLSALLSGAVFAAEGVPTEMDPVLAGRAVKLADKLRCLVCQNQTIADSHAELANDLRTQIREQIAAGKSDDEILTYMVDRYGDFVLYQPPFKATTVLLWGGPALLVMTGAFILLRNLRRRQPSEAALSEEDHERAQRLLAGDNDRETK